MSNDMLNEREFELVNIVGAALASNQRDLSRHMALSLGMTNMLIRRLISKGYIRIKQLDKRKVEYALTPKGFSEKMKKSVNYTMKTINSIGLIRNKIKEILKGLYDSGTRKFYVLGESDLVVLTEMVFRSICADECELVHIKEMPQEKVDGIILICKEDVEDNHLNDENQINVLKELAKDAFLIDKNGTTGHLNG